MHCSDRHDMGNSHPSSADRAPSSPESPRRASPRVSAPLALPVLPPKTENRGRLMLRDAQRDARAKKRLG
eukprot:1023302-Prymnesium_polylepis.1